MYSFSTLIIFSFLLIIAFIVSVLLYLNNNSLKVNFKKLSEENNSLKTKTETFSQLETEKQKFEEKNKKLWAMSEAVYKEKAKVDEANEKLVLEKEKLGEEKKKVDEKIKKLWNQSTAIHKEKERINEIKIEIERKHTEIIDSVNYAKRIQDAILPDMNEIKTHLPDSFILFKPRDIVSGDFYWFSHKEGKSIIAAVDCTGHGVPGAFMSMIGNTVLNQIVNEKDVTEPSQILNLLNEEINASLKQNQVDSESRDGMDIAICCFDRTKMELHYAGANRPLYYLSNLELTEIKPNKCAIGGLDYDVPKIFTTQTFALTKGDTIYISTDGYADQFSPDDKKLMTKRFKEMILSINTKSMEEQRNYLDTFIENWKGTMEQTDDILVIGVII